MGTTTSVPRPIKVGVPSSPAENDADKSARNPERAIEALKELQRTLHVLSPAEQWEVKKSMPFATAEWQEGLALSLKPTKAGFGESVHGEQRAELEVRRREAAAVAGCGAPHGAGKHAVPSADPILPARLLWRLRGGTGLREYGGR